MPPAVVLVVEDDPDHRKIVSTYLRHKGYGVLEATNGKDAVELAGEHRPDLVIMDGRLPVLDGWEATERLKADPQTAGIPVVILTAHALKGDRIRSDRSGCDAYLSKPAELQEILSAVERWTARS